jgi:hypothetical protein
LRDGEVLVFSLLFPVLKHGANEDRWVPRGSPLYL